ncbi:TPA: helix-turn-helix domain-containing protein [Elizabethkingia anophelis]|nr:helix-turn-helix domain-containing protein [Elizabethkingia anophelis]HAY3546890.1 helix-turn-helix domain-containing protein [Elizabethkingia anophelis]
MGFSKLRIPKICEFCEKPFEAKTVTTRFCSKYCSEKLSKQQKKQTMELEAKQALLNKSKNKIADLQTRPYISVSEAATLFGMSKDTVRRLIKSKTISSFNFGERLTRVSRLDMEALFTVVELPVRDDSDECKNDFVVGNCYTLTQVSEKFNANPSTVGNAIKRNKIPTKQVGSFVYVPKRLIDKIFDGK